MKNIFWETKEEKKELPKGKTIPPRVVKETPTTAYVDVMPQNPADTSTPYKAFVAMKNAMGAIPIEATKYVAAFAGMNVHNVGKQDILDSAQRELDKIGADTSAFNDEYKKLYDERVVKQKQMLADKSRQLAELSAEIGKLDSLVKEAEGSLEEGKGKFMAEQAALTDNLNMEIGKIKQYI